MFIALASAPTHIQAANRKHITKRDTKRGVEIHSESPGKMHTSDELLLLSERSVGKPDTIKHNVCKVISQLKQA